MPPGCLTLKALQSGSKPIPSLFSLQLPRQLLLDSKVKVLGERVLQLSNQCSFNLK